VRRRVAVDDASRSSLNFRRRRVVDVSDRSGSIKDRSFEKRRMFRVRFVVRRAETEAERTCRTSRTRLVRIRDEVAAELHTQGK